MKSQYAWWDNAEILVCPFRKISEVLTLQKQNAVSRYYLLCFIFVRIVFTNSEIDFDGLIV